jgi:hypothetical protein
MDEETTRIRKYEQTQQTAQDSGPSAGLVSISELTTKTLLIDHFVEYYRKLSFTPGIWIAGSTLNE